MVCFPQIKAISVAQTYHQWFISYQTRPNTRQEISMMLKMCHTKRDLLQNKIIGDLYHTKRDLIQDKRYQWCLKMCHTKRDVLQNKIIGDLHHTKRDLDKTRDINDVWKLLSCQKGSITRKDIGHFLMCLPCQNGPI